MEPHAPATPEKGHEYERPDGSTEVVYTVEDGRVLTFREYPSVTAFNRGIGNAAYVGENDVVKSLPGAEAFRNLDL